MNSLDVLVSTPTDQLFQKWDISTIRSMRNDLEKEIVRKKDEIRVLVGEKYRDFVDVSQRIHEMSNTTKDIEEETAVISSRLNVFCSKFDVSVFSSENCSRTNEMIKNEPVVVLRKLLIDIENQIWTEIDSKRFISATCLLQLAIYTKTVLNLECVDQKKRNDFTFSGVCDLVHRFPLVLNEIIEQELKSVDLTSSTACECFCSMALLQNLRCACVIERFLSLRLETLELFLRKENPVQNVRSRFHNSFLIIIKTLQILYYSFGQSLSENVGEYWKCLKNVIDSKNSTVFHRIDKDRIAFHEEIYVPSAVKNFNVKGNHSMAPLDQSENCKMIDDWLRNVRERIVAYLPNYLNLINSLQSLNKLKQVVPIDDDTWMQILEYFNLTEHFALWDTIYEPLVTERAKTLLSQRWNAAFSRIRNKIESVLRDGPSSSKCEEENDLHSFLWTSNYSSWSKRSSHLSGLLHSGDLSAKVLGLSPNTEKVCAFIETSVLEIMNELSDICPENDAESPKSVVLRQHQQHCCIIFVERLIHFCGDLMAVENVAQKTMLFLARLLSGISVFCPSLKQCMLLGDETDGWNSLTSQLSEESLKIWRQWSRQTLSLLLSEFRSFAHDISTASFKLKYLTKWCAVKLTEEDNNDDVRLKLRVPFQASSLVQSIMNELAKMIGRTLPPRIILMEMRDSAVTEILNYMEEAKNQPMSSVILLQFFFDVKYLTLSLIPVENEKLNQRSKEITDDLEKKIDPVDLDLILPSLLSNVQSSVYNTQNIFGALMDEKSSTMNEPYADSSEDPSVIYVATNDISSFPLFPISSMGNLVKAHFT